MRLMATFSFLGLQYAAWTTAVAPLPEEDNIKKDTINLEEQKNFWLLKTAVRLWQLKYTVGVQFKVLNLNKN